MVFYGWRCQTILIFFLPGVLNCHVMEETHHSVEALLTYKQAVCKARVLKVAVLYLLEPGPFVEARNDESMGPGMVGAKAHTPSPWRTALQKSMRALYLAASSSEARRPRHAASGDAVWAGRGPHPRGSVTEAARSQPAERDDGRRDGDVASRTVRLADDVADVLDNDDHAWRTGPRGVCQRPDLWCAIKRPGRTPRKKICPRGCRKEKGDGRIALFGEEDSLPRE